MKVWVRPFFIARGTFHLKQPRDFPFNDHALVTILYSMQKHWAAGSQATTMETVFIILRICSTIPFRLLHKRVNGMRPAL